MTDFLEPLIGPTTGGLIDTFGIDIVQRALELAKGQPPEVNLMPYIDRAIAELSKL